MAERHGAPPTGRRNDGLAVVVLAAGASSRFGGFPKALLHLPEETAVGRIVRLANGLAPARILVVVGPHGREIRAALSDSPADVVDHPGWAEGRTGSIQAGIARVPETEDLLLWPVDHPLVNAMTLRALVEAAEDDRMGQWFIPTHEGRSGHPVLLRAALRPKLVALASDAPLRDLLAEVGVGVRRVAVHDPGVLANLDSPGALDRALADLRAGGEE